MFVFRQAPQNRQSTVTPYRNRQSAYALTARLWDGPSTRSTLIQGTAEPL